MNKDRTFVVCIENQGYAASLEQRKLYESIPDASAEKHGHVRVIDESGEDYLYPKAFFREVRLSKELREAVSRAA
jgi:hypothetical protein